MANVTYIGSVAQLTTGVSTTVYNVAYAASAGHQLVLGWAITGNLGPPIDILTVTDDGGNTWSFHISHSESPVYNFNFYTVSNVTAPTTTITVTLTSATALGNEVLIIVGEYADLVLTSLNNSQDIHAPDVAEWQNNFAGKSIVSFFITGGAVGPFLGPDAGGSERRKLGNGAGANSPILALVDDLTGTGATSETVAIAASAFSAFGFRTNHAAVTGNIVIEKVTSPPASLQSFDFTTDYGSPFTLSDGGSNDSGQIATGTYSVTETPVAGWTTTISSDPSAIVVTAGVTTTVTFTNTLTDGQILVVKATSPGGATTPFTFTPSYGSVFTLTDGQSSLSIPLDPGTYSVTESPITGWTTTVSIVYGYGQGPYGGPPGYGGDISTDNTQIVVSSGDTITVTFTNTQVPVAPPCGKVLTRVDTWEMDNGLPDWSSSNSVPIAWYDSNLGQQKVGITYPSQNGTIGLLYIQLAAILDGSGIAMTIPDDWTPYVLWGALADLLNHDGPAYDPVRAKYCQTRYDEGVELARLVLKGA